MGWFEVYLKHKDIITKKIEKIERKDGMFEVTYKDKLKHFYFFLDVADADFDSLEKDDTASVVLIHSEHNFKKLIDLWPKLIKNPKLCVYSVNPFSQMDNKWIIFPYTHHQISDPDSLKAGLRSMFDTVDPISIQEYEGKV